MPGRCTASSASNASSIERAAASTLVTRLQSSTTKRTVSRSAAIRRNTRSIEPK